MSEQKINPEQAKQIAQQAMNEMNQNMGPGQAGNKSGLHVVGQNPNHPNNDPNFQKKMTEQIKKLGNGLHP